MIIVQFMGGLGNQLFQYAIYAKLISMGKKVKADISYYTEKKGRPFKLEDAFGIQVEEASLEELEHVYGKGKNFLEKLYRKNIQKYVILQENSIQQIEDIVCHRNVYIEGFWQSHKWFEDIQEELRSRLNFVSADTQLHKKLEEIEQKNAVSIHVRMGDYLIGSKIYGGICTEEYYRKAIEYIKDNVENPYFYVVSDEPEKAKEMLGNGSDMEYLNSSWEDFRDMQIISVCKHHIMANSSFSWWGVWLNKNADKIVVAPQKWNNIGYDEDIYDPTWIRI